MIKIDDKLNDKLRQQMDCLLDEDEELKLRLVAKSYAVCEHSIAVLSNLRTDKGYIYYGRTSDILGLDSSGRFEKIDTIWEKKILNNIHPDDYRRRNIQELAFLHFVSSSHADDAFDWHMESTLRMTDNRGNYLPLIHRVFYFPSKGKRGVSYAICLYNLTTRVSNGAILKNSLTGEERQLNIDKKRLLSEREITIITLVREGYSSKEISTKLNISKYTVDRHRQNIINKIQATNMAEACHKAEQLGLVE